MQSAVKLYKCETLGCHPGEYFNSTSWHWLFFFFFFLKTNKQTKHNMIIHPSCFFSKLPQNFQTTRHHGIKKKGSTESESIYQTSSCEEQVCNERVKSPLSEVETGFCSLVVDGEKNDQWQSKRWHQNSFHFSSAKHDNTDSVSVGWIVSLLRELA